MPIPIADEVQAGIGLAEGVVGLINAGKTKRIAEQLNKTRPQYAISPLAGEGLSLAKSELANGMSSGATKAYNDLNNQQFSSSLSSILKGGGDINSVGDVYGNNQEGRLKLAQIQDQLRLQQIQNLSKASENYQQEQQTAWQLNQFAPWEDKAQANANARLGANQQIQNGFNTLGAATIQGGQAFQEQNQFNPPIQQQSNLNGGYTTGVQGIPNLALYPSTNQLTTRNNPFGR